MSDIQTLLELSDCDTRLRRAKKSLDELPEAGQIMKCRATRKELKAKQDQVIELTDDVNEKIEKLQTEESHIIEKLKELQDTLDHSSDYRVTSSVTRDMEGQVKRQKTIAQELDALLERQIKIDHVADQVAAKLQALDEREDKITKTFKEKGGEIRKAMEELKASRQSLVSQLPQDLAQRYEKVRAEKNGIALGRMESGHCTACGSVFPTGQLKKLMDGPALTECPNCHRIFIVEAE